LLYLPILISLITYKFLKELNNKKLII